MAENEGEEDDEDKDEGDDDREDEVIQFNSTIMFMVPGQ